jgi:hypothetical protein
MIFVTVHSHYVLNSVRCERTVGIKTGVPTRGARSAF